MARRLLVVMLSALLAVAATAAAAPKTKAQPKAVNAKLDAKHELAIKAAYSKAKTARNALSLSTVQKSKAAALEKKLSAAQRAALTRVGARLLAAVHASQKAKKKLVLGKSVVKAIEGDLKLIGSKDADALAAVSLQATADAESQALQSAAKAAEDNLVRTKRLRESIASLREVLANWSTESQLVSWTEADGRQLSKEMTKSEANALLARLEAELETLTDQTSLFQLELQDAMNKQAQALQLISALMKAMHDTAQSIIDNLK